MSRRNLLHRIVVIPLVIFVSALLGCGETIETIEIDRASFSGRVVDEAGNPVAGLALVVLPCEVDDETDIAVYDAETNDTGHFSIMGIYPGKAQFMLVSEYQESLPLEPEYQLLSFKIGISAYHPKDLPPDPCTQNTFFIGSGARIENVEVTVRLRMRIRAKVVLEDGTPLADKKVSLNIRAFDSQRSSVLGGIQGSVQTDAQGYFVQYVDRSEAIGYRVSVEYKWLCATSEIFILGVGERRESLILKLSGPPQ
ncbi:MAG: carboxypeptidase-like regulatory domain-containing protein [Candidatus Poribacteria bacterium]|nr:carboxypeptidase-like regulatory domain-containing protein [Candidatus Poribacteria bacterium]